MTDLVNSIVVVLCTVIIIVCSIGIIIATKFQNKQKKKYNELTNIINENKDATFKIKDVLTKEEINKIDDKVDVDALMKNLYDIYLELVNKLRKFDTKLDDILVPELKDFYMNKIKNFKENNFSEIIDAIELINYSIVEYSKNELKFRITTNCFHYKTINNNIVSGSNLEKVEQISLLSYKNIANKWLISDYEIVYEKN